MPEGIGYDIAGDPQEDANVAGWKDFLKRPENLATALVLAAMVTSPKQRGQSSLNKALVSGAGALGFRGALESGVADRRRQGRLDRQAAEAQAAEIAQGAERNRTASEQVDVQREGVNVQREGVGVQRTRAQTERDALTTPPQMHPSQAAYLDALAQQANPGLNYGPATQAYLSAVGTGLQQFDPQQFFAAKTTDDKIRFINELDAAGKVVGGQIDTSKLTPEERARMEGFGIAAPVETAPPPPAESGNGAGSKKKKEDFSGLGGIFGRNSILLNDEAESKAVVRILQREPQFDGQPEETILEAARTARQQAAERNFGSMSEEELRDFLSTYRRILSLEEANNVRDAIKRRSPSDPIRQLGRP